MEKDRKLFKIDIGQEHIYVVADNMVTANKAAINYFAGVNTENKDAQINAANYLHSSEVVLTNKIIIA
jgi:hypothetical protein